MIALPPFTETDVLRFAASLERASEDPLAHAIVEGARSRGVSLVPVSAFQSLTGKGVTGSVEGRVVSVGSAEFTGAAAEANRAQPVRAEGQTVVFVAVDGKVAITLVVREDKYDVRPLGRRGSRHGRRAGGKKTTPGDRHVSHYTRPAPVLHPGTKKPVGPQV